MRNHFGKSLPKEKEILIEKTKGLLTSIAVFSLALMLSLVFSTCKASPDMTNAQENADDPPTFDILLRVIKDAKGSISHVEVSLEMDSADRNLKKPFTLRALETSAGIGGIADRIEELQVTDDKGVVDLNQVEESADSKDMAPWRRWQASRLIAGPLKVHYRCSIPEPFARSAPPMDLRVNGGGVSGAGYGFLALPDEEGLFNLRLHWDLTHMETGSIGMSSLGEGDIDTIGPIDRIFSSYFMAGRLGRFPEEGNIDGFSSAWLGKPPFDAQELMVWTAKAYAAIKSYFQDTSSDPFRFFMRAGPDNDGVGGGCLQNSVMLFIPEESDLVKDVRGTAAHEIIHKYIGELKEHSRENRWYSEGLVVHYTRLLMFRAGLFSASEFLDDVNRSVLRYWTNPLRNLSKDIKEERYWSNRNAMVIPYDRGSLYFAFVDAKIRAASKGKRSLDDVVLELFARRAKGEPLSTKGWLEVLEKEIGSSARTDFDSIIVNGKNFTPASNAFGDGFKRVPIKLRVFELGFDDAASLLSPEKKVTGLVKGSAAERAGLQNGDIILSKVDLRSLRKNDNLELSLKVRRGEETLQIEYLPRGESVDGYKWIRNSDVPEEKCR
jgi:hypothetical protein